MLQLAFGHWLSSISPLHRLGCFIARLLLAALAAVLLAAGANAQSDRQQFAIPTPIGPVLVESFGSCGKAPCAAVVVLSGSKGFTAPAYSDIGRTLQAAGLDTYLVHVLSAADLKP